MTRKPGPGHHLTPGIGGLADYMATPFGVAPIGVPLAVDGASPLWAASRALPPEPAAGPAAPKVRSSPTAPSLSAAASSPVVPPPRPHRRHPPPRRCAERVRADHGTAASGLAINVTYDTA